MANDDNINKLGLETVLVLISPRMLQLCLTSMVLLRSISCDGHFKFG